MRIPFDKRVLEAVYCGSTGTGLLILDLEISRRRPLQLWPPQPQGWRGCTIFWSRSILGITRVGN